MTGLIQIPHQFTPPPSLNFILDPTCSIVHTFRFAIEESFIMAPHQNTSRIKNSVFTGFAILIFLSILIIIIPGAYLWLPAKVHYHVVEKHTVSVTDGQAWVNIGILIPRSGPYQTVSSPIIQWSGEQEWISYALEQIFLT